MVGLIACAGGGGEEGPCTPGERSCREGAVWVCRSAADGYDFVWSWITGSETVGSIYCVVPVSEIEAGEDGAWAPAVPEDGQQLWADQGFDSE